ncbi:hypothetical protein EV663_11714 [Rhodovulum bhavnagarense]|uniref:AlpA family transcriptional regulator n=1 Tax=Rhodovulum bhavnagarense TaxID=992286 RepID=A0A4R2R9J8_9RHOB|nr:hypothetical protein [Rhodovulum bhavnagarense]TCP58748.1 hypothetical protein EV663_11714 [Rhodovulum bhavnagarense]
MQRLAVRDITAAQMLDMPPTQFRRLVADGALPPPTRIAGLERWRVDQLQAILSGEAAKPNEDFEL